MVSWSELRRYCQRYGTLRRKTSHEFYDVQHPRTGDLHLQMVSHGNGEIPPRQWKRILKQQLQLTQEEFKKYK